MVAGSSSTENLLKQVVRRSRRGMGRQNQQKCGLDVGDTQQPLEQLNIGRTCAVDVGGIQSQVDIGQQGSNEIIVMRVVEELNRTIQSVPDLKDVKMTELAVVLATITVSSQIFNRLTGAEGKGDDDDDGDKQMLIIAGLENVLDSVKGSIEGRLRKIEFQRIDSPSEDNQRILQQQQEQQQLQQRQPDTTGEHASSSPSVSGFPMKKAKGNEGEQIPTATEVTTTQPASVGNTGLPTQTPNMAAYIIRAVNVIMY